MRMAKRGKSEEGIVLLLTLLALLLIAMVVMAMAYMAMNEGSLVANERSSTQAWEAARAGLEEARGRLSSRDLASLDQTGGTNYIPQSIASTSGTCSTTPCVTYIVNSAESSDQPWTAGNAYFDSEFDTEFGVQVSSVASGGVDWVYSPSYCMVSGVSSSSCTIDGINYNSGSYSGALKAAPRWKWVRITLMTEQSAQQDVNLDGTLSDGSSGCGTAPVPCYITWDSVYPADYQYVGIPSNANQYQNQMYVYRLTSYARLSDGTSSEIQEDVAPGTPLPPFPSALTICGSGPAFTGGSSAKYGINGVDAGGGPTLPAIGTCGSASNVSPTRPANYSGSCPPTGSICAPSVADVSGSMNNCLETEPCLDNIVQTIAAEADQSCYATSSTSSCSFPNYGTTANPLITVVNGNLSLSGSTTGAGILLVTGNLTMSGDVSWQGVIIDVGMGSFLENGGGSGSYQGAVYVAQTLDASSNPCSALGAVSGELTACSTSSPYPTLGTPTMNVSGGGNSGIQYSSTDINLANHSMKYSVIAFRQITPTQ